MYTGIESVLSKILKEQPENEPEITLLASNDANDQSICEATYMVHNAQKRWEHFPAHAWEYEEILSELHREVCTKLSRKTDRRVGSILRVPELTQQYEQ